MEWLAETEKGDEKPIGKKYASRTSGALLAVDGRVLKPEKDTDTATGGVTKMDYCGNFGKTIEEVREGWTNTWSPSRVCKLYMPWCRGNGGCPSLEER